MRTSFLILCIAGMNVAMASSESHGEASIKDLFYPILNFSIFAALIIWKAKGPISKAFTDNSKKIAELFTVAEKKDKEAEIKFSEYQKKIGEVESICDRIIEGADVEAKTYAVNKEKEIKEKIERYGKDAEVRVNTEKDVLIREVNESLLNEVIVGAKNKINNDPQSRTKVTSKLMSSI